MYEEMITRQELIDAQVDAKTLEDVVNGPSGELINTRLGRQVYTLASIPVINAVNRDEINELIEPKADKVYVDNIVSAAANGVIPFQTQSELLLAKPTQVKVLAKAMDVRKEYLWNRTSAEGVTPVTGTWTDTGLSDKDLAEKNAEIYTNTRVGELINSPAIDLFQLTNKITGSFISPVGVQTASTNWSCSGFLPVKFRDVIEYSATANNSVAMIAAYDSNKTFLRKLVFTSSSSLTVLTGKIEIEADVKFVRVAYYSASSTAFSFLLKAFELETDLLNKKETSDMVWGEITAKTNLFVLSTAKNGYSLINNVETSNTNWIYSDYIAVVPNGTYTTNGGGYKDPLNQTGLHFYDAAKNLVSYGGAQAKNVTFSVPADAYFMRINFVKTSSPTIADIVVNTGTTASKSARLEDKVKEVLLSSSAANRYNGKTLMTLGDSITDSNSVPYTYPPIVAASLGMSLFDGGWSGRRIRNAFGRTTIASETNILASHIITIAHGTNDFKLETSLGTIDDSPTPKATLDNASYNATTNQTDGTFYADYKGVIEHILTVNPQARIMLITPIRRTQKATTGTDTNAKGHKLVDYVNAVKEIAQYYGLPVLDNYNTSGFNTKTIPTWTSDGLHPTEWAQRNVMAQKIIGFIESN